MSGVVMNARQLLAAVCTVMLVGLTAASSTVATAQDRQRPARVGEIWFQDKAGAEPYHRAFHNGMKSFGYVEGHNVTYFTALANGDETRFPKLIAEMLARNVDVLFVSQKAVRAATKATSTIPIVCATMNDPVGEGIVSSLARPGGNITGLSWQSIDTAGKRLELGCELMPNLHRVAVIFDPDYSSALEEAKTLVSLAKTWSTRVKVFEVRTKADLEMAFSGIKAEKPQLLILVDSAVTSHLRKPILDFALHTGIAAVSEARPYADDGALLTFGANLGEQLRRGAAYVDKILKGAKPSDLPIEQPTKFELVINLKTAKVLGITIPQSILLRADEVIR